MKAADKGWLLIAVGVCVYEMRAATREWELLSEACDRYRRRHPWITDLTICYLAAHLLRAIPGRIDPLHRIPMWLGQRQ